MVATRNHPKDFEPPVTESPTKRTTRTSTATAEQSSPIKSAVTSQTPSRTSYSTVSAPTPSRSAWAHTPSNLTLIWLAISLPLVIWDTGYVLLRPYTFPGGSLYWLWKGWAIYGSIDHMYGIEAWDASNGWTAAQGTVNALETVGYMVYLYLVYTYGHPEKRQGRGAPDKSVMGSLKALAESRTVYGRIASGAVLLGYSTALLTAAKTVLYFLNEVFSGFDNIKHNDWVTLLFMWFIMNGLWIALPIYMCYVFGGEILQGLDTATNDSKRSN